MKFRADFVTNSSSSSFITVRITTKDRKHLSCTYDSGNNSMRLDVTTFSISDEEFETLGSCNELLKKAFEWFSSTFEDSSFPVKYDYSYGDLDTISKTNIEEVRKIEVESNIYIHEFEKGLSELSYTYYDKESYDDADYEFDYFGNEAECAHIIPKQDVVVIPNEYNGRPIVSLGDGCFAKNNIVKKILIPKTLCYFGKDSFSKCNELRIFSYKDDPDNLIGIVDMDKKMLFGW